MREVIHCQTFTPRAQQVIDFARARAEIQKRSEASVSDIIFGILELRSGVAYNILLKSGMGCTSLETEVEAPSISQPFTVIIPFADEEARRLNHTYIGTEHLLLAVLRQNQNALVNLLQKRGIGPNAMRAEILKELS